MPCVGVCVWPACRADSLQGEGGDGFSVRLLGQLTEIPMPEIDALAAQQALDPGGAAASSALAYDVVRWVHGESAASAAASATAALFKGGAPVLPAGATSAATWAVRAVHAVRVPDGRCRRVGCAVLCCMDPGEGAGQSGALDGAAVSALVAAVQAGGTSEVLLLRSAVLGVGVLDVCVAAGLCKSKGEARRLLSGGGLTINQQRVAKDDSGRLLTPADLLSENQQGGAGASAGILLLGSVRQLVPVSSNFQGCRALLAMHVRTCSPVLCLDHVAGCCALGLVVYGYVCSELQSLKTLSHRVRRRGSLCGARR